jgi:tight adherence protein C
MTWALAGAFVISAWLGIAALRARVDPAVAATVAHLRRDPPSAHGGGMAGVSRTVAAVAGGAVGFSATAVDPAVGLLTAPVLALAGWRLPGFLDARVSARERAALVASVPELLDVVAVAVTAGLSPRLALDRAAGAMPGPLGDALAAIRRDVDLGGTWTASLRQAAERLDAPELRRLAVVMDQGRRLGAPVAERVRTLARDVRAERRARREERARRAPVAMLFPLVFLILPAFVLAAVVPAVLVAVRGVG